MNLGRPVAVDGGALVASGAGKFAGFIAHGICRVGA